MSQALYRKYRSQRFAELVGQQGVTRVLRNAIVRGRLGHAYLFCGPRGTGKTSVARIFAKAINCLNPREGDCCGECEVCLAVAQSRAVDVIEIDAASYRQVDEIKEILIDRVGYAPQTCQRKVYIIDEVHMLSPHSFNALLKTLEEPPGHVVFCLCTTEPHKLPLTILSRCVRFDFHRLPQTELAAHLQRIASTEGYSLADDAARELALLSEGSARDSISLLDQLLVYCESNITLEAVRELFQLSDPQLLSEAVDLLAQVDAVPLLAIWENLASQGADAGQFLIRLGAAVKERYLASGDDGWRRALGKLWEGLNLLKYESFPALLVELTLLSAQQAYGPATGAHVATAARETARRQPVVSPPSRPAGIPADEPVAAGAATDQSTGQPAARTQPRPKPRTESAARPTSRAVPESKLAGATSAQEGWPRFMDVLRKQHMTTYALVQEGVIPRKEGNLLRLVFDADARTAFRFVQQPKHQEPLRTAASTAFESGLHIAVEVAGEPSSRVILQADGQAFVPEAAAPVELPADLLPTGLSEEQLEGLDASVAQVAESLPDGPPVSREGNLSTGALPESVKQNVEGVPTSRPATKQDILELFDAIEIEPDSLNAE